MGHCGMEIVNIEVLEAFSSKHANARKPFQTWLEVTRGADWTTFADVRNTFGSADYVSPFVVFNIGGNNFRLVTIVKFENRRVTVARIMTHAEYDRWKP